MSREAADRFANWAPAIAQAIVYSWFTVIYYREYAVNHKPWYYILLAMFCGLCSLGMIAFACFREIKERRKTKLRTPRFVDGACACCGGVGYIGMDGDPCPACHPTDDLRWVAGGQVRVIKKKPETDPDKEPFGVKGSL